MNKRGRACPRKWGMWAGFIYVFDGACTDYLALLGLTRMSCWFQTQRGVGASLAANSIGGNTSRRRHRVDVAHHQEDACPTHDPRPALTRLSPLPTHPWPRPTRPHPHQQTHHPMMIPRLPRPLYHPLERRGTSRPTPKMSRSTESVAAQLAAPPTETGRRSSSRTRRPALKHMPCSLCAVKWPTFAWSHCPLRW